MMILTNSLLFIRENLVMSYTHLSCPVLSIHCRNWPCNSQYGKKQYVLVQLASSLQQCNGSLVDFQTTFGISSAISLLYVQKTQLEICKASACSCTDDG